MSKTEAPDESLGHERSVFLIGFMAAGKTTVGRRLAELMGYSFIDLDSEIERSAERTIPAIFSEEGEDGFRRREADTLRAVIEQAKARSKTAAVVATGGGAPCHGDNLAVMRANGLVIALTAPLDELKERVADPSTRPMLRRSPDELQALYDSRIPHYRQAHASVRTEDRSVEEVARNVVRLVATGAMIPDRGLADASILALSERAYPIIVAPGALSQLGELCRAALAGPAGAGEPGRVGLISDSNVAPLYSEAAGAALEAAGFSVSRHVIPAGEPSKCFAEYSRLVESLAGAGLDRRSAIVALGGGVVGDLAGFVAASLFRGIPCVQVPTTILAMVDSAIGGKTGINISAGKNLVGAFWQPRLVLADPDTLETLPVRERRAAFGELVKYGLLDSEELYEEIDRLASGIAASELSASSLRLTEVIRRCAAFKSWIVSRDEREQTGERALLNLGHTVGHAIEAVTGYGQLLHGEAVGLGLVAACRVSARLNLCEPELETRVVDTLRRAGLDADVDPWLRPDVIERIGVDKKRTGKTIRFVTIGRIGQCSTTRLELSELSEILRR